MQFVARNVAKEELDSTSATVAGNVARKVLPCVRAFILMRSKTHSSRFKDFFPTGVKTTQQP